jgi:hypothetical protein
MVINQAMGVLKGRTAAQAWLSVPKANPSA